jgi:hypothetical protein
MGGQVWGFDSVKDWLDVLVIPGAIFALGALFPWWARRQRRRTFLLLIRQELGEMAPRPEHTKPAGRWPEHLRKRFIHEAIFLKPSENRDFILSLSPNFAYNEVQLWMEYEKGEKAKNASDLEEHGARWCDYLREVCRYIDNRPSGPFYENTCAPWERLIKEYHP